MHIYNVIYTRTESHNFITEVQVRGSFAYYDNALACFNNIKTQIIANDPKYKIAEKEHCVDEGQKPFRDNHFCFWIDGTGVSMRGNLYSDYYEVTLRIVETIVEQ